MNSRKEFLEKLEKFKFENPELLKGGDLNFDENLSSDEPIKIFSSHRNEIATTDRNVCGGNADTTGDRGGAKEDSSCVEMIDPRDLKRTIYSA